MLRLSSLVPLGFLLAMSSAHAETVKPELDGGRYSMSPVDGGFLRLDKQSGTVSMCAKSGADWSCKPITEQGGAAPANSSEELSKVEKENLDLKARVKALEETLETEGSAPLAPPSRPPQANDGFPPPDGPPGGKIERLPTEEEVDQALDYVERVYKKIRDRIKNLDGPLDKTTPVEPPKGAL